MQFYQLAKGARFDFRGKEFQKTAMSMAEDAERIGNIFPPEAEVTPIGEPLLLPAEEAEKWKPCPIPWTDYITPAPGES
jgi:hypothetical protein